MKKWTGKILRWAWLIPIAFLFSIGFSTRDYGSKCTRCLREYGVVEHRFCGLTYYQTRSLRFEGHDLTPILGARCEHVYRTNGFGQSTWGGGYGCGITAEGALFRGRWETLEEAFRLDKQFPNRHLMQQTFQFADRALPPNATIADRKMPGRESIVLLSMLGWQLRDAKTEQEWATALKQIQNMMAKTPYAR